MTDTATGVMRNGEDIELDFYDYTECALPKDQWLSEKGDVWIASAWLDGGPVYWNHKGHFLAGLSGRNHPYDLVKVNGYDAFEYLYSRGSA